MTTTVVVIGPGAGRERLLARLPSAVSCRFHGLLTPEELDHGEPADLVEKAAQQLDALESGPGAILTTAGFPASAMVPLLCTRYGLPGVSLAAALKCVHRYWGRLEQAAVIDELPRFGLVDLTRPEPPPGLGFPLWLKPLTIRRAVRVDDVAAFTAAAGRLLTEVAEAGDPFGGLLAQAGAPPEVTGLPRTACLAEQALYGVRAVAEGFVEHGRVIVHGVLDTVTEPGSRTVVRRQYPSQLPEDALRRMALIAQLVLPRLSFDGGTFRAEFFCEPVSGQVCLLSVDPGHDPRHGELFELVDGIPAAELTLRLALGGEVGHLRRKGSFRIAGIWPVRGTGAGVVRRVPSAGEVATVRGRFPGVDVRIDVAPGQRVTAGTGLARLRVPAQSEYEMTQIHRSCREALPFQVTAR